MPAPTQKTRAVISGLALSLALVITPVIAEDGTSGSTPTPTSTCTLRAAAVIQPAASPVASPVITTAATPVASMAASPMASPVSPGATPVASPVLATPVAEIDPLTADLAWAADGILDCMSENNIDVLTGVTSPEFRGSWLGMGTPINDADLAALLPWMPQLPYEMVSVENVSGDASTATATVIYTIGRELHTAEWTFTKTTVGTTAAWMVESEVLRPSEATADATTLKVTITDGAFAFAPASVASTEIVLDVSNTGTQPHEVLILRVQDGTTPADIAAAPTGIPAGATFIAQATVPAGASGTLVLTDVRAGTYTVVDMLPNGSGVPNISAGMIGTFEVTKP